MGLFQQSVLKKHLNDLNKEHLNQAWQLFKTHFHNPAIQQHIRDSKEEEYQEGFVRDLFVNILGYTLKPQPHYNFVLEKKTEADATKSDGALLRAEHIIGVVELKDSSVTELDKVEKQVFGYKHKHKNCVYVITSNFEKLRFYIHDAIDFEEFNLFALTQERFAILYLCLQQQHIQNDVPLKMKQASLAEEENITKKLYADYSNFKNLLFQNITALNPQYNKLDLFQKTQKLLDRFLFILFAEDRLLVPPNSVREILNQWEQLKELDNYVPLFERFKKYFGYLNTGYEGKQYEIFAYNGGLFAADEILDNILIDDTLLYNAGKTLSNYDFESEVGVNILGHIFEHSLSEIEEVQAELEGKAIEKTKTKRKKDGVFYTPKYITKYIVENTVGELCKQKKEELEITEETFSFRRRKDQKREKLYQQLKDYREWLFRLTICDPACGSGAFLNQALEFLIAEHRYIDELKAKFLGDAILLSDVEGTILENNLFGVDINEEAVEIARLSLWLRTARKGRKLNDLSKNIKCGNSLIDDPAIAGVKAFNWQKAFPAIFKKGGFDVVIGNPPYVFGGNEGISQNEKTHFKDQYQTGKGKVNLFTLFIEKSFYLLKDKGAFSFIIPNTFLRVTSYDDSRRFFLSRFELTELADLGKDVFEGAVTTATILIALKNIPNDSSTTRIIKDFSGESSIAKLFDFKNAGHIITTNTNEGEIKIIQKLKRNPSLGDYCKEMIFGVVITKNKDEIVSEEAKEGYKPFLEGKDISSYLIKPIHQYLNYKPELLHRARTKEVFEVSEKILIQRITGGDRPLKAAYDNQQYYNKESINNIILNESSGIKTKFILTLLNSKLINWFYTNQFTNKSELTVNLSKEYLSQIPLSIPKDQLPFMTKADIMLAKTKELQELKQHLLQLLQSNFPSVQVNKKLEQWPSLYYADFLKELSKQRIKSALPQQAEWMNYFEEQKTKANAIKTMIEATDKEIDRMVYELYDLTEEEIKIVEGA
jgi:type I restriction-modification system DNA methylase subunit